jgi:LAGLIDADG DNA endonuclease family protein
MFVWTSLDSELDGGFAAGLIAGDGHFAIRPNNGGTTWQCLLAVCLRADDTPLLTELCRWSGAGMLQAVPAQRTSRPQTNWIVQRQADCLRMVSILDRYPLLGKKLGQYEIWRKAILAWTGRHSDRQSVIAECSERLRAHRRPEVDASTSAVSITADRLLAFLAGFATAEAHFGATSEGHPHFRINLRRDDGELLRALRNRLGLGRLVDVPPYRTSNAAVSWRVSRLTDLRALTYVLDRYPPRGRVLRIYEAWRELVLLEDRRSGKRRLLAATVKDRRAYEPGLEWIDAVDAPAARRQRHIAVLEAWAADTDEPRTVTAYDAWRRRSARDAPNRDTIVRAFGAWTEALRAAGVGSEGCRPADTVASMQAVTAPRRAALKAQKRASILAAVRDCAQMLGRDPRATEYMAWRRRFAPETPSHTTVYRTFPDGWASVLQALAAETGSLACAEPLQAPAQPLHVPAAAREDVARVPDVQPGSLDQVGHEGVAGKQVAARQCE